MQYKLINNVTKEETICEKVEIDGFDYYVNNDKIISYYYNPATNNIHIESHPKRLEVINKHKRLKIIATNNPSIDIPQMINDIEKLSENIIDKILGFKTSYIKITEFYSGVKIGFNKAKETYQYTEQEVIDFAEWMVSGVEFIDDTKEGRIYEYLHKKYTTKELLQIFKEQQIKTIFYE